MKTTTALFLLVLSACNTPCQNLCVKMADYARDCGIDVSESQVDACIDDQADADDQGACRQAGDVERLRQEWACEDVQAFF